MSKSISALAGVSFIFALTLSASVAIADGTDNGEGAGTPPVVMASPSPVPTLTSAPPLTKQDNSLSLAVSYQSGGKTVVTQGTLAPSKDEYLVSSQVFSIPKSASPTIDIDFVPPHELGVNLDYLPIGVFLACEAYPARRAPYIVVIETKGLKLDSGSLMYSIQFSLPSGLVENCEKTKFFLLLQLCRSPQEEARKVVVRFEYK